MKSYKTSPDKVRIDIQASSLNEPDLFEITTTYTPLVKINLLLPGPLDPGLIIDQDMMEALSKYFDISEGIEKYFDCMRIEGDFASFACPMPIIGGFAATSLADTTVVLPADTLRAGTDDLLIISGACFGNFQGDSYVEFTNARRGPEQNEWVRPLHSPSNPLNDDYISWSDSQIMVFVPSVGQDSTHWYAGTGKVRVVIGGVVSTSLDTLRISHAIRNRQVGPNGPNAAPNHTLQIRHGNRNGEGGYDLYYSDYFLNNFLAPDANLAFERALLDWRCLTDVNFVLKDSSNIDDITIASRIDFEDLPAGVETTLARYIPISQTCGLAGDTTYYRISRFNVLFNQNLTWYTDEDDSFDWTGTGVRDLQSRAVHELGHAHGLLHSNNPQDLMYWKDLIEPLSYRKDILSNDASGAIQVVNSSVFNSVPGECPPSFEPMSFILDCEDGLVSIYEYPSLFDLFQVGPNPTDGSVILRFEGSDMQNYSLSVYSLIGEQIIYKELNSSRHGINLNDQANGIYLLNLTDDSGSLIGSAKILLQR